jgi:hypothetical protein
MILDRKGRYRKEVQFERRTRRVRSRTGDLASLSLRFELNLIFVVESIDGVQKQTAKLGGDGL